jgi:hypothetical protein
MALSFLLKRCTLWIIPRNEGSHCVLKVGTLSTSQIRTRGVHLLCRRFLTGRIQLHGLSSIS